MSDAWTPEGGRDCGRERTRSGESPAQERDWYILPDGAPPHPKPSAGTPLEHGLETIKSYTGDVVPVPDHIDMGGYIDMRPAIHVIRKCQPRFKSSIYDKVNFPATVGSQAGLCAYALLWEVPKRDAEKGLLLFQTHKQKVSQVGRHGCWAYVAQCHRGNELWAAGFRASIGYHRITCHPAGEEALVQFKSRTNALRASALMIRRWTKRVEAEQRQVTAPFRKRLRRLNADLRQFVQSIDEHRLPLSLGVEFEPRLN